MTTAPRTRIRPTGLAVALAAGVGLIVGVGAATAVYMAPGVAISPAPEPRTPSCATEDSTACFWDAATQGNGQGESFYTDANGTTYYVRDDSADCIARVATDAVEAVKLSGRQGIVLDPDNGEAYAYRLAECAR